MKNGVRKKIKLDEIYASKANPRTGQGGAVVNEGLAESMKETGRQVKALSFLQPWAQCVLDLGKRTENRPRVTHHRGPVVLHISKGWDKTGEKFIWENWEKIKRRGDASDPRAFLYYAARRRGGFGGVFEIKDCWQPAPAGPRDIWTFGPYCYSIEVMGSLPEIIPAKGQLGFWNVPGDMEIKIMVALGLFKIPENVEVKP
jgi:hypothetical protein